VLVLLIIVACNPIKTYAQVFISEVYPAPASGDSEWVELCNSSEQTIDLTTYYLMDQLSTPSILLTFASKTIDPLSAVVLNIAGSKLNNTGDSVLLYSPSNQVLNQVTYGSATTGQSFSRQTSDQSLSINPASPGLCLPQHFPPTPTPSPTPTPTPLPTPTSTPILTATPLPTPTSTPKPTNTPTPSPTKAIAVNPTSAFPADQFTSLIEISEIMACPESGSSEWLELYNFSNMTVDLTGWYVLDAVNNKIDTSIVITPQGYGVVEFPRAIINNSGDSLSILSPDGVVRWQTTLGACTSGQSFALTGGQFVLGQPTPNSSNDVTNTSTSSSSTPTQSISTTLQSSSADSTSSDLPSSSLSATSDEAWPAELTQVLGDFDDLTWPKLLNSDQSTTSATLLDQQLPETDPTSLSSARLAIQALFGSSLGGAIMLSSGLILCYVTWKANFITNY